MSDEFETIVRLAQQCLEATPVIILGSGASVAYGVSGMGALQDHLVKEISPESKDEDIWNQFKSDLTKTRDLEVSLQNVNLPAGLILTVVRETRNLIVRDDLSVFQKVISKEIDLEISRLFRHLFRSTNRTVSVITTNYDRLAEYGADGVGYAHFTGFNHGYYRQFDSVATTPQIATRKRCVNVWKVHGSVDWFHDASNIPIALPYQHDVPDSIEPLLVTPGTSKYELTHGEPFRSIMTKADEAMSAARAFLCIGYGFNDSHIEPKLVAKVRDRGVPIVILARTLRDSAKKFLENCSQNNFVALEREGNNTKAYHPDAKCGVSIPDKSLWDLPDFLNATID